MTKELHSVDKGFVIALPFSIPQLGKRSQRQSTQISNSRDVHTWNAHTGLILWLNRKRVIAYLSLFNFITFHYPAGSWKDSKHCGEDPRTLLPPSRCPRKQRPRKGKKLRSPVISNQTDYTSQRTPVSLWTQPSQRILSTQGNRCI